MEEILGVLVEKAGVEAEEAQRLMVGRSKGVKVSGIKEGEGWLRRIPRGFALQEVGYTQVAHVGWDLREFGFSAEQENRK